MEIKDYIQQINEQFKTGNAREHSYRPMLQQLLNDMLPDFIVTNEPARISCGAPDFIIISKKMNTPVFFVEAKDINDNDLDGHSQHKEQFTRYKESLDHIIFTDYLDFHLYENGEWVKNVRLAEIQGNKITLCKEKVDDFKQLIGHIATTQPKAITSATTLARQMAAKARTLASTIKKAFALANENEETREDNQQLQSQLDAFRNVLIHDLTPDGFADIYAQTIAYGMFAARLHDNTPEDFSRQEAAGLIPKSNPFLRQIFQSIAGYDLDARIAWVVDDLVSIFLATDIKKVMQTYSNNELHHDPMIHFYEDFLSEYDRKLRKSKGVWYTPLPVVQFIVRAVDDILQRDFGLAEGLADCSKITREVVNEAYVKGEKHKGKQVGTPTLKKEMHRVQILDPATGTGTFLAEVVNHIYDKFRDMQGMWQSYVTDHLIPRLHGFELLMASYAVAHLKLDMLLQDTGFVQPENQKRLRIYLTNSLEECDKNTGTLWSSWLSNEANEANRVKRDCPVMVMIGNPPYSGESQNKGEWIMNLMETYKKEPGGKTQLKERNPKWINDDYVKFIRLAQDYVERNGEGVIGFINPHGFLDNPTFRGMRWNLLKTFDKIYTIDLHGNSNKKEICPDGSKDENVFDIKQGVSINLFVKTGENAEDELGKVYHKDLFGLRDEKYEFLNTRSLDNVGYEELHPQAPMYFFVPKDFKLQEEYEKGIKVDKLIGLKSVGVVTSKDKVLTSFNTASLICQVKEEYNIEACTNVIWHYDYRPFDSRFIYYDTNLVARARENVMCHLKAGNIGLIVNKQIRQDNVCPYFITCNLVDLHIFETMNASANVFPIYLYTTAIDGTEEKVPNLNHEEWQKFNAAVGRETTPEELLAYIYVVLHSPHYRERYKEFLKIDFPRIPLPSSAEEFERLGQLGQCLINLHLMHDAASWKIDTTFPESGDQKVSQIKWVDGKVWINDEQYFGNVPESAWTFYIGGYQPAQKWLKDRKDRFLSFEDLRHYQRIIYALTETQKIMEEIDR